MSCKRSQEFLANSEIAVDETVIANKRKFAADEALAMARGADHVWVAKGKKFVHWDMAADTPDDDELCKRLLGRSGTMRAPAIITENDDGRHLLVGFNQDLFEQVLAEM